MNLRFNDKYLYKKRGRFKKEKKQREEGLVKTKTAEIGEMHLQVKEEKGLLAAIRS